MTVTPNGQSYASGYAAKARSYASYAVTRRFQFHMCRRVRVREKHDSFAYTFQPMCNRVTHVTTPLPRVTARVTIPFSRNQRIKEEMSDEQSRAAWLKENLPGVDAAVKQFAAVFGRENIKVVYAKENGHEIGKPGPDGVKLSEALVGSLTEKAADEKAKRAGWGQAK